MKPFCIIDPASVQAAKRGGADTHAHKLGNTPRLLFLDELELFNQMPDKFLKMADHCSRFRLQEGAVPVVGGGAQDDEGSNEDKENQILGVFGQNINLSSRATYAGKVERQLKSTVPSWGKSSPDSRISESAQIAISLAKVLIVVTSPSW